MHLRKAKEKDGDGMEERHHEHGSNHVCEHGCKSEGDVDIGEHSVDFGEHDIEIVEHKIEIGEDDNHGQDRVRYDFEGNRYENREISLSWCDFEGGGLNQQQQKSLNGK